MMDGAFIRSTFSKLFLGVAMAVSVSVTGALAQTQVDRQKAAQTQPKEPSAPTATMESPELPKKPDNNQESKAPPGQPVPPEQPYPAKTKK